MPVAFLPTLLLMLLLTTSGMAQVSDQSDSVASASSSLPFEGYDAQNTRIHWPHAAIVGGVLGATVTGIHLYQANAWWSGQRTSFHFQNDPDYAKNVDKAGHFFGGVFASNLARKSLQWSGLSEDASVWWGFAVGSLFELYVEFEDGFARDWGFSPGDAGADLIGAAWPVLQHEVPVMKNFQPKFSYWPSRLMTEGKHPGNGIDDYEGQTYWMGVRVHDLLPSSVQRWWPDWLGIAVGVAVRGMANERYEDRWTELILAFDYDMTRILPGSSWLMVSFKELLNHIKFPSPAVRITPHAIWYGFYF